MAYQMAMSFIESQGIVYCHCNIATIQKADHGPQELSNLIGIQT